MHTYVNTNTLSSSISKRPELQTHLHITMETPKLWGDKRERAIKELVKGRDIATQLQNLLLLDHNSSGLEHGFVSPEELVAKISDSFTQTLSLLDLTSSHHLSSQDTGDSTNTSPVRNRRGRYKRRKTSDSWVTVSSTLEDGYSWRKYGQKEILNSKYPRCYFRCTHKHDQGCQALKQVQQSEEDGSKMFNVTYFGRHKCNRAPTIVMPVQTISDSDSAFKSGNELFNDYLLDASISLQENDSNEQPMLFSLEMGFDDHEYSLESSIGHAYASTNSYGLDTRSLIRCVSFDNDFQFDENDFFGIHIPSL